MLIDLSVSLNENVLVYPGDPPVKIVPGGTISRDGYQDHLVSFPTHAGTHIDAPSHMISGGKNLDQIPLERFRGRGVYIEARDGFALEAVWAAQVQAGDVVIFHSGMSDRYDQPEYFEKYPDLPENIVNYLVAQKITMAGFDMCSPDHAPFPMHKILLQNEVLIIENLTNLAALAGKKFNVYAFPMKFQVDGAPTRVVAETT